MQIILDSNDDFNIEMNEYLQFSLYDKEGTAKHFQCTNWYHQEYGSDDMSWWSQRIHPRRSVKTIEAYRIKQLTVETPEEKIAKETVKKAKESLKAAEDTLKAVKEKK